jgi:hypothetical protein
MYVDVTERPKEPRPVTRLEARWPKQGELPQKEE